MLWIDFREKYASSNLCMKIIMYIYLFIFNREVNSTDFVYGKVNEYTSI